VKVFDVADDELCQHNPSPVSDVGRNPFAAATANIMSFAASTAKGARRAGIRLS